jgi:hypothetical protein
MAVSIDVADGGIDREDTKIITVTGEDVSGDRVTLQAIDLTLDVGGQETTLSLADFGVSEKEYTTRYTFTDSGLAMLDCTITDIAGSQERVQETFYVRD